MHIEQLAVGELETNCYIVYDDDRHAVVIDAGGDAARILQAINQHDLQVDHMLLTHVHFDHILAVREVAEATGADLLVYQEDVPALTDPGLSLLTMISRRRYDLTADRILQDGDSVTAGSLTFRVLHTPGHTPGSCCYVCEDVIFSGDTLFEGSIGRTDFPGGSFSALQQSLKRLKNMEGDYTVLSGHGDSTTLERERQSNPFME